MPFFMIKKNRVSRINIDLITIEEEGFHLVMRAIVNDKEALLLIDTGASRTVFDKSRLTRFEKSKKMKNLDKVSTGLGTNTMETQSIILKKVELGQLTISGLEVMLLDLSHVNASYQKLNLLPIDGVIGSDLLVMYSAEISFEKKLLTLKLKK